jgi:hypothetical protein
MAGQSARPEDHVADELARRISKAIGHLERVHLLLHDDLAVRSEEVQTGS